MNEIKNHTPGAAALEEKPKNGAFVPPIETARVYFALWPSAMIRTRLRNVTGKLSEVCGGRPILAELLHLSLVFIGEIPISILPNLSAAASEVKGQPFSLQLRKFGCWHRKWLVWVAPEATPPALTELVTNLRNVLKQKDIAFDEKIFIPHVTLLRDAECKTVEIAARPITWRVHDFVLVRSVLSKSGPDYEVIGRWNLE